MGCRPHQNACAVASIVKGIRLIQTDAIDAEHGDVSVLGLRHELLVASGVHAGRDHRFKIWGGLEDVVMNTG